MVFRDDWAQALHSFYFHRNGDSIRQGIEYRGMISPQPHNFLQLLIGCVGLQFEVDADPLVSLPHSFVEPKKSVQIDIALERRLDFFDLNAASRCVIDHSSRSTSRQCV